MKMKTQRKGNSLTKADKLARKETIKFTFIASFITALLFCLCMSNGTDGGLIGFVLAHHFFSIYTLITWLVATVCYWFLAKPICIRRAYNKVTKDYSKILAKRLLIPGKFTKIRLNDSMAYNEFFSSLATDGQAEYYAVLGEKDNLIELFLRLKANKKNYRLAVISAEAFSSFCEVMDEELT